MSLREPLTVECPRCHTRFRVREDQLTTAGGQVRCGACLALFNASQGMPAEPAEAALSDIDDADDSSPSSRPLENRQDRRRRTAMLWVGVTVALAAFAIQLFAYRFDRWALDPELRFIYEFGCGVIGCELPAPPGQDVDILHGSPPPAMGEMPALPHASAVGEAPPAEGSLLDRGASLR